MSLSPVMDNPSKEIYIRHSLIDSGKAEFMEWRKRDMETRTHSYQSPVTDNPREGILRDKREVKVHIPEEWSQEYLSTVDFVHDADIFLIRYIICMRLIVKFLDIIIEIELASFFYR